MTATKVNSVLDRVLRKDYSSTLTGGEKVVMDLMKEVNAITSKVSGSPAFRVNMRNEIRGLNHVFGLASFF